MSITPQAIYAPTPNTERGKTSRLTTTPKGEDLVYVSGSSIVIRNVKNPAQVDVFSQHRVDATVARVSPSGFYCASADSQGNIFVWDTTNKVDHIVKYQKRSFSGGVTDLAWSEDSKRILAVGDGKEVKGEVFGWDTGSSLGEISGHIAKLNACAFRQQRPYRVVTGGDDKLVNFYSGPPFRYTHSCREQSGFVNTIEYSPDGSIFVASGADHNIYVYDGVTGLKKSQFSKTNEHKMGVYSVAFSLDGKQLVSVSADKTAKLWDVATGEVVATYTLGTDLADTPYGSAWTAIGPAVVTLRGDIVFYDPTSPSNSAPIQVWRGHHKSILNLNYYPPASGETIDAHSVNIVSASADGQVLEYSATAGAQRGVPGYPHGGKPVFAAVYSPVLKKTISLGSDDVLLIQNSTNTSAYAAAAPVIPSGASAAAAAKASAVAVGYATGAIKLSIKQPKTLALFPNGLFVVAAAIREITVVNLTTAEVVISIPTKYDITAVTVGAEGGAGAVKPDGAGAVVVVGGVDHYVHFYKFGGKALQEYASTKGKYPGAVAAVGISANGEFYAASRDRFLAIGKVSTGEVIDESRLMHTAKINAVDFSPDGTRLVSGGLDSFLYVWTLADPEKFLKLQGVHAPQGIYVAKWIDNTTVLTGGGDYFVRTWKVSS